MKRINNFIGCVLVIAMMGGCMWGFMYQLAESLPPGPDENKLPDAVAGLNPAPLLAGSNLLRPAAANGVGRSAAMSKEEIADMIIKLDGLGLDTEDIAYFVMAALLRRSGANGVIAV